MYYTRSIYRFIFASFQQIPSLVVHAWIVNYLPLSYYFTIFLCYFRFGLDRITETINPARKRLSLVKYFTFLQIHFQIRLIGVDELVFMFSKQDHPHGQWTLPKSMTI
jgi:hypothetical protein